LAQQAAYVVREGTTKLTASVATNVKQIAQKVRGQSGVNNHFDIDPMLTKHLDSLPRDSYKILGQIDTKKSGGFSQNKALEIELLKDVMGTRFYGGGASREGAFVVVGQVPKKKNILRQYLGLSPFYKQSSGRSIYNTMKNQVDVEIGAGAKVLIGQIGEQKSRTGKVYKGGGTQILTQPWLKENANLFNYTNDRLVK
jgi:hypothetical protein